MSSVPRTSRRRVCVTGGREFSDVKAVIDAFDVHVKPTDIVVHGCAKGADTICENVAFSRGLSVERHPAHWKQLGRRAGYIRNGEMLHAGIDLLLAFPGGKGTDAMVSMCRNAGVKVVKCGDWPDEPAPLIRME